MIKIHPVFLGHHQDDITCFFRFEDPKIFPPSLEKLASLGGGKPCMQDIVVEIVTLGYIGHASSTLNLKTVGKDCRITILLNSPLLTPF